MPASRTKLLAVALSVGISAVGLTTGAADGAPAQPHRHTSGLLVLPSFEHGVIPPGLADEYDTYELLAEANPEDFGYVHEESGQLILDVASESGRGKAKALGSGRALPDPAHDPFGKVRAALDTKAVSARGKAISLRQVTRNRSATERIKHDVTDLAQQPALADADIWQAEVDRSTGRVIVRMSRLTNAAADAIVAAYGTEDVAVIEEPNPEATDQFGRLSDSSSFWGGARIGVPSGSCTDAFSWNISSTVSGMLTAGHCIPNGGSVSTPTGWMGTVASGSRENYSSTGTVYLTGQSTYRGDMALIQVNSDKSSSPFIYRGGYDGTSSGRVTGMMSARSKSGDKYCTGGSYSGEICGWTVDAAGVDRKISDKWKRNIVVSKNRQGWCTRPGDSGGSVYIVNSSGTIQAKGINNSGGGGGSDYYGGALDPCHQQFTDIWDAYYGFPGTIKS